MPTQFTELQVLAAAQAIRAEFMKRVISGCDGFTPTPWEKLKEPQRVAYLEEAKAALDAAAQVR